MTNYIGNFLRYDIVEPTFNDFFVPRTLEYLNKNEDVLKESVRKFILEHKDYSEVLKEASTFKPKKYKSNNKKFVNNITKYIENDNHISWYNRFRYVVNILFLVILIGIVILIVS